MVEMLKLFCKIVGEDSVFSIDIEETKAVDDLKDKIKEKKKAILCDADQLTLYQAKKNDQWLVDEDADVAELSKTDGNHANYILDAMKMKPTRQLALYFSDQNVPQFEQIHVLVKLPDGVSSLPGAATAAPLTVDQIEMALDRSLEKRDRQRGNVTISRMTTQKGEEIKRKLKVHVNEVKKTEEKPTTRLGNDMYKWLSNHNEDDDAQVTNYMKYLKSHLDGFLDGQELYLVDVHDIDDLLNIRDERLPFDFKGGTDVLIMSKDCDPENLTGLRMLIEVKTEKKLKKGMQKGRKGMRSIALAQLVAADLVKPDCSPIVLLTNLTDVWTFLWFGENRVVFQLNLTYPKNAFDFIQRSLSLSQDWKVGYTVPSIHATDVNPFKRVKLDDILPESSEPSLEEIVERYRFIADSCGPDVALAQECARSIVRSIPLYSNVEPKTSTPPGMYI